MHQVVIYPVRLARNSVLYLNKYGLRAALAKSKSVVRKWFNQSGQGLYVSPITVDQFNKWIAEKEDSSSPETASLPIQPKISVLMPVYNPDAELFKVAINSVLNQTYQNFELCLYDDASPSEYVRPLMEELAAQDSRIKIGFSEVNQHISLNTNLCFSLSTGEYLFLMDNDDELPENAFAVVVDEINKHPKADLIYFDEDKLEQDKNGEWIRVEPWFKPSFSPEMLYEMMYPTHGVYSRAIYEKAGMLRKGFEGCQDYDLVLRVMELTDEIYHIPRILYHWRKIVGSTADNSKYKPYIVNSAVKSIEEAIVRRGYTGKVLGEAYPFKAEIDIKGTPSVEIIIPTKDRTDLVRMCINSIMNFTEYKNYSITLVDNNSEKPESLRYFDKLAQQGVKILKYEKHFNYSAINNFAVSQSEADFVLLLNNDTKIMTPTWIEEMLRWAQMPEIGAVGAKLLFPDMTIQHGGVIIGHGPQLVSGGERPVANHAFYLEPEGTVRHYNMLNFVHNMAAVTAACVLISRSKFNEVGGLNEKDLVVAYNDVDLCLKLFEVGYRNLYTPHARIIHYESVSRVKEPNPAETEYMYKTWLKYIEKDPYYNPNFSKDGLSGYVV